MAKLPPRSSRTAAGLAELIIYRARTLWYHVLEGQESWRTEMKRVFGTGASAEAFPSDRRADGLVDLSPTIGARAPPPRRVPPASLDY
jgi:hypothetical protein